MSVNEGRNPGCGPSFVGDGKYSKDTFVGTDSNTSGESYSDFGHLYKHADYMFESIKARNMIAGSNYSKTVDIQVFVKTD